MSTATIRFSRASIGLEGRQLQDFSWTVEPFESWVVTGPNGSGKSLLAEALAGTLQTALCRDGTQQARVPPPEQVALVSFERQRDLIFRERYFDDSEFMEGGVDPGTLARTFLFGELRARVPSPSSSSELPAGSADLVDRLGLQGVLDTGLKYLSTGEIRKLLFCREVLRKPALIVFDEPFEGLDEPTRRVIAGELERLVSAAARHGDLPGNGPSQVIVISDRIERIPPSISHVLLLHERRVLFAGPRKDFDAGRYSQRGKTGTRATASLQQALIQTVKEHDVWQAPAVGAPEALVTLRDVTVSYGERAVLNRVHLEIAPGEHTLVRGPNGCGKSTLLNLINGDNPQVYANDVTVCGIKRGSGESILDVKAKLGQVSYALHVEHAYQSKSNVLETVLSGFSDSIGLNRPPLFSEIHAAERLLKLVELNDRRAEPFSHLSYGEQRVALVLRAVVKQPQLLILDEPCHGLDARRRGEIMTIVDFIVANTPTTLIYVTHNPDEYLRCTKQTFDFVAGGWRLTKIGNADTGKARE